MKHPHLVAFLAGLAVAAVLAADASAMYHPTVGRFMQRDPSGYADGMNLYQYAASEPGNRRDPSGLVSEQGCCGLNIDKVFLQMLGRLYLRAKQLRDVDTSPPGLGGLPGSDAFRFLEREGIKMDFFVRSRDGYPSGAPCKHTLTLCDTCVPSWQVNNTVYGFMSLFLGLSQGQTEFWADMKNREVHGLLAGESIFEKSSYRLGRALASWENDPRAPNTVESMCDLIKGKSAIGYARVGTVAIPVRYAPLPYVAEGGKFVDVCQPCAEEAKHEDVVKDFSQMPWGSNDGTLYNVPPGFPPFRADLE